MRTETRTQEWYMRDPGTRKWIRQCTACGIYGRDPETPASVFRVKFGTMFPPISLNELGICDQCAEAASQIGSHA